jgi:Fic family protein
MKKWIWQHQEYPHFKYDKESLVELISQIQYNHGVLNGIAKAINSEDIKNIELDALIDEAVNTSEIEGEYLKRDSVRASLYKKLSFGFAEFKDSST